jgi:hypothetical protein
MIDIEHAIDRIIAGLEKKNRLVHEKEREIVAYHEAGHAIVAERAEFADPVHKISIIPRGVAALGYTQQLPTDERYLIQRQELNDRIAVLMGGRAAEEMVFGEISTGAGNDLERATDMARRMVAELGMSPKLGPVNFLASAESRSCRWEGRPACDYSEATAQLIDAEVQRCCSREVLQRALTILRRTATCWSARADAAREGSGGPRELRELMGTAAAQQQSGAARPRPEAGHDVHAPAGGGEVMGGRRWRHAAPLPRPTSCTSATPSGARVRSVPAAAPRRAPLRRAAGLPRSRRDRGALAYRLLAATVDIDVDILYEGRVSHQENLALVHLLDIELTRVTDSLPLDQYDGAVFIDNQGTTTRLTDRLHKAGVPTARDHRSPRAAGTARSGVHGHPPDRCGGDDLHGLPAQRRGADAGRERSLSTLHLAHGAGARAAQRDERLHPGGPEEYAAGAFLSRFADQQLLSRSCACSGHGARWT